MFEKIVCQNYIKKSLKNYHGARTKALFDVSWSLTKNAHLTLTSLGRHMSGTAYVKHKIKRVDRLLGNRYLHRDLLHLNKAFVEPFISTLSYILLAVDWSGYDGHEHHVLRASILYKGRSIPIYNEVYPQSKYASQEAHDHFLDALRYLLPKDKKIIIVTDAGFTTPWFESVSSRGWYFVGRGKLETHHLNAGDTWQSLYHYEASATAKPTYVGEGRLGKSSKTPVDVAVFTYREKSKNRHGESRYPDVNKRHSKQAQLAWVIVTNLQGKHKIAHQLVNIYKKRMQVEQNFRDDKSIRFGYGWRLARVRNKERIAIFCLIATIATFFLWWIGYTGECKSLQKRFQANTIRDKRVLSFIRLAKEMLRQNIPLRKSDLYRAAMQFCREYNREFITLC